MVRKVINCDFCKKDTDSAKVIQFYHKRTILMIDGNWTREEFDICPECLKSLYEWKDSRKENNNAEFKDKN